MHIGNRLRGERQRLDMTQTEFAEACGVTKRAQINYESDERAPTSAYLAAAAGLGIDVNYLLTGERHGEMDAAEVRLLAAYRVAPQAIQRIVQAALLGGAGPADPRTDLRGANIGQQVSGDVTMHGTKFHVGGKRTKSK